MSRSVITVGLLAVATIVVVLVVVGSGSGGHTIEMTVPHTTGLARGFDIRLGGRPVGSIASVQLTSDYRVRMKLRLDDDAWPLPQDTTFQTRLGGTIKFGDRYLEVARGSSRTMMHDGQTLPASSYVDPVEFDQVFDTFNRPTRRGLSTTIRRAGLAATGVKAPLPAAMVDGPAAAAATERLLEQLGDDPATLDTLVRSAAGVADSAAAANPGLGDLVQGADATFTAIASRTRALQSLLDQTPATLTQAQTTLDHANATLVHLGALTDRLGPGVTQLRATARPLSKLLSALRAVTPVALTTLGTLRAAVPDLDGLLDRVRSPLMPQVTSIGRQATRQLRCIRPFTPEIGGLLVNWAGFFSRGDAKDKYIRAQVGVVPYPNESTMNSAQLKQTLGSAISYAFPRPPGIAVDQPWFQPACGITRDALDPSKDPEATNIDPLSKPLVDFGGSG
jgi:ABC-type transporter Mla subunit MlaD